MLRLQRVLRTLDFCTVSCVHRVALLDCIRTEPIKALDEMMPAGASGPFSVRVLRWMFVTSPHHDRFRAVAGRLLGSRSTLDAR
jgi:hypothetical protein